MTTTTDTRRKKRKQRGLSLRPHHPESRADFWFYEEKAGIHVYFNDGNGVATDVLISRKSIEAYLRAVKAEAD